jgi:hypothetical protein
MKRVLAIQSHVVSGYVGNKAATFPLQLLGIHVDPICSVHFSNHTGYPKFTGTAMDGSQLSDIVDGLETNGLLQYSHMLTGYVGKATFLTQVIEVLRRVRLASPDVAYGMFQHLRVPKQSSSSMKLASCTACLTYALLAHRGQHTTAASCPLACSFCKVFRWDHCIAETWSCTHIMQGTALSCILQLRNVDKCSIRCCSV